ncbi:nickel pincer cofactor biosynthesis protein LarC [Blautia wexlerae]|uniref:nickel pincer cofactor biosynthesis protein LarC n=1 Tax=Blautia wexlerae TaxID=418240 RepID=UPI00156EB264|nr:nickel pincer cofactor biosynthesis protein LarC [Blautia wexlerae]MCB5688581.1 nickel pincer cofactor biosynthesis protein LarC [Blautia wexlerae]NSD03460.1 nickel pincer cofactor biosynthesis protein LarC [Blautia wexlerae]NSE94873.1 nickel pincer cofactor biosynthesis protein LarC [Blautia wexlerae]NSF16147.1 nickel pincer cofactor biosynthesis protein LarC [Blautia wexlerae]NSF30088.1 nickel pincer cofactor biosynthesis protein LarC [Blautia wexlerae]
MGKTLYLECYSGISGDMTVAALLDLGADRSVLDRVLKSLKVSGFETKISRVVKSGIDACDFDVVLDKEHENHDHDMEYLHGHHHKGHENNHFYNHNHAHEDEAEHFHSHEHNHAHGAGSAQDRHHHEHRGIKEITYIIEHSAMTENAKKIALRIFEILAEAESKAHNVPVDQVHFHEVGAVDSIVDIVSVAVCLDDLDVTEVIVPVLCEGRGTVRCQHGILPIPVPAVANIVSANHLYLKMTEVEGELVTPTGAAIVAAVKTKDKLPETFEIQKIGIGAGKRQYECPGILRAMIISQSAETDEAKAQTEEVKNPEIRNNSKAENQETKDTIIKMETNIDDCSGEVLGFVMERLMKAGARDVHYVPVFMKKNRPAWVLNVICKEEDMETLQNIIFEETTTIGIRYSRMERTILPRETRTLPTPWGEVLAKVCTLNGKEQIYPEYESVAQLSREKEIPFTEIYRYIVLANKDKE